MAELQSLLTTLGTPALILGAAVVAWQRITQLERSVEALWAKNAELDQRVFNHVADAAKEHR